MATLPLGTPVSVAYSGASVSYVPTADGQVTIHLWGGAGSGGYYADGSGNLNKYGGAGGYTNVRFMAKAGDTIDIEVGQGGQVPTGTGTTASSGGAGGWPDGGYGGRSTTAYVGLGGGGGSSRVYLNGELIAVAGGGGGATGFYAGGNGGGGIGVTSTDTSSGAGGTRLTGGVAGSGTLAVQSGGYFSGGKGGATAATAHAYAGGGGGGGLYGGASNGGGSLSHGSGGGGSGWISQTTEFAGLCKAGPQDGLGTPYTVAGVTLPAGVAQGGTGPKVASTGWGSITPGGNGYAYLTLTDIAASAPSLPAGSTTLSYTGAREVYKVTQLCAIDLEMWGGGGAGGYYTSSGNNARWGGAGGYTKLTRVFYPGDIIEVEVAQGGQPPLGAVGNTGGIGGWPNGGDAGRPSVNTGANMGGGGGSTNVWVNGRLLAIASGGGGATGFYYGGNGGGRFGLQDAGTTANSGTGGTWGGANTTSSQGRGYFLSGGVGSPNESKDVAHPNAGAGGGGGFWGGGGAKGGSGTHGAGGGGCGYVSGDNTYNRVMQAGTPQTGVPFSTANRPAGIGQGGAGGSGNTGYLTTTAGGNGACLLTVNPVTTSTLPTGKTVFSFTNAAEHYIAPSNGVMALKVWGAGGGGCTRSSGTLRRGGGGGFLKIDLIKIAAGDIVTFVVGEGGKGMPGANLGGRGGFPNGEGGNAGDATGGNGGGGGSSHVYINGKLVAVAAGGGGGAISFDGGTGGLSSYPPSGDGFGPSGASLYYGGYSPQRGAEGNNRGVFMLAGIGQIDGASLDTPNNLGGGGGGGGYWGGAGSTPNKSRFQPGGAGSTYILPGYVGTQQVGTNSGTNTTDADWGSSASVGGQGSNTPGNAITNGGHGRIVCQFDIPATLNESVSANTPTTAQLQTFMVGNDGTLTLKTWGAGGGGAMMTANSGTELAGGGGYATATLDVKQGQILRVYNGNGGQGAQYTSGVGGAFVGTGGPGGWPDGGQGGMHVSGIFGGGGGSTRVYLDEVLLLVAGGGGGGGIHTTTTTAGGGGGATGQNSDTVTVFNTGGQTYRGGVNTGRTTDATTSGSWFKGGAGYLAGSTASTSNISHGGGGGGGLYGGSGSGSTNQSSTGWLGGAGGSGFVADGWDITEDDYLRDYVAAQYSFDTTGGVADDARKLNTLLLDTAPTITTSGPKYGTSCLNINGGHLTTTIPAIGQQDFTLEGWFNPASISTGVMMLLGDQSIGGLSLHHFATTTTLGFRYNNAAVASDLTYVDTARAANVWAHYAIVRDIGGTRIYKDGILVATQTGSPFAITATTLTLGNYNAGAGASTRFTGKADEVRLTIGAARYRQNFKPVQFRNKRTLGLTNTALVQGANSGNGLPASTGVAGYVAGRGVGAAVKTTAANGNTGGDGQVNYFLQTSTVAATGPIGTVNVGGLVTAAAGAFYPLPAAGTKTVHSYTGSRINYVVEEPGGARIRVELWGAGGGGCSATNSSTSTGGGGGGYTVYEMDLVYDDRITLQTPSGGFGATTAGGNDASGINAGGYPDGGNGYKPAFTAFNGGGGGSARMWARGDLAAVAGGGGGGAYGSVAYDFNGGAGGGTTGRSGAYDGVNATFPNTGGTQTTGGSGSPNGFDGSFMQGGNGGVTISIANNGPGGGGGYYGGGGGGAYKAAGGGSSYVNTLLTGYRTGSTTGGSGNLPGGMASPNYAAGVGVGSNNKPGVRDGGAGRIVLSVITPTPGNAAGTIGTVNVSGLDTTGRLIGVPTGALPTINLINLVGQFGFPANVNVPLPSAILVNPVESNPTTSALVIVPINDNTSISITGINPAPFHIDAEGVGETLPVLVLAPEATVSVPAAVSGSLVDITIEPVEATLDVIAPVQATGDIGTITIEPLQGVTDVNNDVFPSGLLGTILVAAPEGVAEPGDPTAIGGLTTITVVAPAGSARSSATIPGTIGDVTISPPEGGVDGTGQGDVSETAIQVVPPLVSVVISQDGETDVVADIGLIYVYGPRGNLLVIGDDEFFHVLPDPIVVTTTAPNATARGDVRTISGLETVTVTPPEATVSVPAVVEAYTGDFIILAIPPFPLLDLAANIAVAMPAQVVINGNDAEASTDITVPLTAADILVTAPEANPTGVHGGDLATIVVTPPQGGPQIDANAAGTVGTIQIEPVRSYRIPSITVIPPEGQALDAISVDLNLPLPPAITLNTIEGGFQVGVNVSLPLTTIFVSSISAMVVIAADAKGAIDTIDVTGPSAIVRVPIAISGTVGTIQVQAPNVYAGVPGDATGALTVINLEPPSTTVTGAVLASRPIDTIDVTAPVGIPRVPIATSGDLATIIVSTPTGQAVVDAVNVAGDLTTITVTSPTGSATGRALGTGSIGVITVTPPVAHVDVPAAVTGTVGTIIVTSPEPLAGVAVDLSLALGVITLTAPEASTQIIPPVLTSGDIGTIIVTPVPGASIVHGQNFSRAMPPAIAVTAPVADVSAGVDLITEPELTVIIGTPQPLLYQEANVIVGFPTIFVYAPDATALEIAEFVSVIVTPPDCYVTVPLAEGEARVRYRRSQIKGTAPASLQPLEIALNEYDGVLFTRDGSGNVKPTPLGSLVDTGLPPEGGDEGQALNGALSWAEVEATYTGPIRNAPPAGATVPLSDGVVGSGTFTPTVGFTYTRPFFVAREMEIDHLAVDVVTSVAATATCAIIEWSLTGTPGATLATGDVSTATIGVTAVPGTAITLAPGWYAATFVVNGAAGATFRAAVSPATVAPDMTTTQSTPAYVLAALET
ncbi:hypothetical protein [Bertelyvirus sp.]|nr:tail protein [Caulobacter phage C2]WGN97013.1 hypothetical protein [Bertelyvirus sp.]